MLRPLDDRILIKFPSSATRTKGGIIIPEIAQRQTQRGIVIAVGDDPEIKVKPGDKVVYDRFAGTRVEVGEEDHLVVKNVDILCLIEEDDG